MFRACHLGKLSILRWHRPYVNGWNVLSAIPLRRTDLAAFPSYRKTTGPLAVTFAVFPGLPSGDSMFLWTRVWLVFVVLVCCTSGCGWYPHGSLVDQATPQTPGLQNPMLVAVADRDLLWDQVVDALDDYFMIQREERVRQVGDVLLEGRIETFPVGGATLLEPWRKDSTPGPERLQSTLQSIRRRAVVRVTPTGGGYFIDLAVYKELEDLASPQHC